MVRSAWWLVACSWIGAVHCQPARFAATTSGGVVAQPGASIPGFSSLDGVVAALREAERKCWRNRDSRDLMLRFDPGAQIVGGRGPEPDNYDVVYSFGAWKQLLLWQLEEFPNVDQGDFVEFQELHSKIEDPGMVEVTRVIRSGFGEEHVRERFRFAIASGQWRVVGLRWWPLEYRLGDPPIHFDVEGLRLLDATVARVPTSDLKGKAQACFSALRYAEAAEWYRRQVNAGQASGQDWLDLAWAEAFAGQVELSRQAFIEAVRRDPTLLVPLTEAELAKVEGEGTH